MDPTRRYSLAQLSRHAWLRQGQTPESAGVLAMELPTPTILPRSADETFNATISAFISASREGFQLVSRGKFKNDILNLQMDVQTAPLLVKRRGMKRRSADLNASTGIKDGNVVVESELSPVPENAELLPASNGTMGGGKRRPTTLEVLGIGTMDALEVEEFNCFKIEIVFFSPTNRLAPPHSRNTVIQNHPI